MTTTFTALLKKKFPFNIPNLNTHASKPWIIMLLAIMYLAIIASGIVFWTVETPHWDMTLDVTGPQPIVCHSSTPCTTYGWRVTSVLFGGAADEVLPESAILCAYGKDRTPIQLTTPNKAIMNSTTLYVLNSDHTCGTNGYAVFSSTKLVPGAIDFIIALLCSFIALLVFYHATQRRLVGILLISMTAAAISLAWYPASHYGDVSIYTAEIVDALIVSPTILVLFLWEILFPLPLMQHHLLRLRTSIYTFYIAAASFLASTYLLGILFHQELLFNLGSGDLLYYYDIIVFSSPIILVIAGNIVWRTGPQRDYARILGVGTIIGFVPLVLFFTVLPPNTSDFAVISVIAFPITLSYAILRQDLLRVDSLIWRSTRIAIQFIGLITFGFISLALFNVFNPLPDNDIYSFIYLVVGISLAVPTINYMLIWMTEHWILPEISRYRSVSREYDMALDTILEPNQIANVLVARLKLVIPVQAVALFIEDANTGRYLRIVHNLDVATYPTMYEKNHPLVHLLHETERPVFQKDVIAYQLRIHQTIPTITTVMPSESLIEEQLVNQWNLYIPIILRKQLIGFLALGPRDDEVPYAESDLKLMKNIIARNAILLDYSRVVNELRQAVTVQQELNQQKDSFLLTVHHEIRTPLTGLLGYIELLRQMGREWREEQPDEVESMLEKASQSAEQLGQLMFALQQAGQESINRANLRPVVLRVKEVISSVAESVRMAHEPNAHRISMQCDEDVVVWADPLAFNRVMTNLIGNAVKYSDAPQPIIIVAKSDPVRHIVEIAVRDWGLGIPQAEQDRIFNPFVRIKTQDREVSGTGLGLYVTQSLVESMEGSIRVESSGEPGLGSTFLIELPSGR